MFNRGITDLFYFLNTLSYSSGLLDQIAALDTQDVSKCLHISRSCYE